MDDEVADHPAAVAIRGVERRIGVVPDHAEHSTRFSPDEHLAVRLAHAPHRALGNVREAKRATHEPTRVVAAVAEAAVVHPLVDVPGDEEPGGGAAHDGP